MNLSIDLRALVLGGLAAGRLLTFLMALPVMGMRSIPAAVKIGLALWLAAAVVPMLVESGAPAPLAPGPLALALGGEFLVGLLLAFTVVLLFATAQMAGQIVGVQIGFSLVNVLDPQTESQVGVLSQFYYILAMLLFVALDGPLLVVQGAMASFRALPPGGMGPAAAEGIYGLVGQVSGLFSSGLRLGAPVVVTLLLVSIVMGVMGRTVPQLNVLVVGFPLKILVGIVAFALTAPLLGDALIHLFENLHETILAAAVQLAGGR